MAKYRTARAMSPLRSARSQPRMTLRAAGSAGPVGRRGTRLGGRIAGSILGPAVGGAGEGGAPAPARGPAGRAWPPQPAAMVARAARTTAMPRAGHMLTIVA